MKDFILFSLLFMSCVTETKYIEKEKIRLVDMQTYNDWGLLGWFQLVEELSPQKIKLAGIHCGQTLIGVKDTGTKERVIMSIKEKLRAFKEMVLKMSPEEIVNMMSKSKKVKDPSRWKRLEEQILKTPKE